MYKNKEKYPCDDCARIKKCNNFDKHRGRCKDYKKQVNKKGTAELEREDD